MAADPINCKLRITDEKLYWDSTIDKLKQFVSDKLKLSGKWSSPGGEVKLFTSDSLSLKWQGKTKKLITVTGKSIETNILIDLLTSFCNDGVSVQSAKSQSDGSCRKETTYNMADSTLVEEIHESNTSITNGDANDLNSIESSTSSNLIEDLTRLVDVLPNNAYANIETDEKSTPVEISEIKLELAMLWATVNSLQDKHIRNQNNASAVQDQVLTTRSMGTQTENDDLSTRHPPIDFENQLMDYRSNQKAKFENIKPHLCKRTTKRNKSHQADTKDLEQKIKDIEQENASLKTIMQIREDEYKQAQNEKDNENHRPWQIIKPKQTINLKNSPVEGKRELQNRSQDPISIPTSNRFASLENNEMDSNLSNKSPSIAKDKSTSNKNSNDPKPADAPNKREQRTTVIVGDSLLKGIRQHSITKASKTKTLVKCFPGSKINDMKHYCIPVLGTKPKHAIIHCGTNDLRASSSQEITKQMGELCELIIDNCPDTHITISSLLTRSDKEGKKVAEVNNKLKLLCSENNFSFLLHSNIDKECLNKSGLHLNKLGDSTLAKNLIETIKHF